MENRYIRELIEYYKKLGINKFYIGDNNSINDERLSDVLKDYISKGYIEIIDIRGKNISQDYFFLYTFDLYKSKCKWMIYFDIDEYLEFVNKSKTINEYLSEDRFKKCEVIKINWLMFNDNNLIYYDNRTLQERFTEPNYYKNDIRTVKSIVRGNCTRNPWINHPGPHEPSKGLKSCNSIGQFSSYNAGKIYPPVFKYCYIKHYSIKSTEEFGYKIKNGYYGGRKFNIENRVNYYFKVNKFSEEKLSLLEKLFNKTFPWFHKRKKLIKK